TALYQLFSDETNQVAWQVQTALNPMGNPLVTKQITKFGVGLQYTGAVSNLAVTIDTELSSENYTLSATQAGFSWVNEDDDPFDWVNGAAADFTWYSAAGYYFLTIDCDQNGKFAGVTLSAETVPVIMTLFAMEFIERNMWSRQ
ncbi:MAG: hypothetical protein IT367_20955, partial [Candidatus Hydrogenedentes bacterium]|nr:hypothetical protein [Candidatus Hydrogenedentota bacterium]